MFREIRQEGLRLHQIALGNQISEAAISIRLDQDVLEWFRSQGPGNQTRMNAVLRSYMVAKDKEGI
jgi:uncharacterized protein (DUF4415 family)